MSNPSPELATILRRTEASLSVNGELLATQRLVLHQELDTLLSAIHANAGRYTRAKLGLTCAYSCLGMLDQYSDVASQAARLLHHAERAMQGDFNADTLEEENEEFQSAATALLSVDNLYVPALYAAYACVAAVNIVLYDSDFETLGTNEQILPPDEWDASFCSSLAHCGGAVWDNDGDAHIRREFWLWYLTCAIPFAWDTGATLADRPPFPVTPKE
jgi:hypothetical protein